MTYEADMSEWWTKPPSQSVLYPRSVFGGTMSCTKDEKKLEEFLAKYHFEDVEGDCALPLRSRPRCLFFSTPVARPSFFPFQTLPCFLLSHVILGFNYAVCAYFVPSWRKKTHLDTYRDACGIKILMLV